MIRVLVLGVGSSLPTGAGVHAGVQLRQRAGLRPWPSQASGVGYMGAPRGGLAHDIPINDGKIANDQAVVPSTWNAGPRDPHGPPGAYEAALAGHRLADVKKPLEILRTIHSFVPCRACAVHVTDPEQGELVVVKVCWGAAAARRGPVTCGACGSARAS